MGHPSRNFANQFQRSGVSYLLIAAADLSWAGTRNSRAVNFDLPAHFLFNFSHWRLPCKLFSKNRINFSNHFRATLARLPAPGTDTKGTRTEAAACLLPFFSFMESKAPHGLSDRHSGL